MQMNKHPENLKQEADEYLDNIKLYATHWGKALLVAGGTLFLTYKIIGGLAAQKKKQRYREMALKKQRTSLASIKPASRIAKLVRGQIALFLLAIAKERLAGMLNKKNT